MSLRALAKRIPLATSAYAAFRLRRGRHARFIEDYQHNSGAGSDLASTRHLIPALPPLLREYGIRTMLDIPCGDFLWMQRVDLGDVEYLGADIIPTLIDTHQQRYAAPRRAFRVLDLVDDPLPTVDLLFCRDCLVHFAQPLITKALANIKRSGSRYLLTTTFPAHTTNPSIITGQWHPLNLCAVPFSLPEPLAVINEQHPEPYADKSLALWRIVDLPGPSLAR